MYFFIFLICSSWSRRIYQFLIYFIFELCQLLYSYSYDHMNWMWTRREFICMHSIWKQKPFIMSIWTLFLHSEMTENVSFCCSFAFLKQLNGDFSSVCLIQWVNGIGLMVSNVSNLLRKCQRNERRKFVKNDLFWPSVEKFKSKNYERDFLFSKETIASIECNVDVCLCVWRQMKRFFSWFFVFRFAFHLQPLNVFIQVENIIIRK